MQRVAVIFMLITSQAYAVEYKQTQPDKSSIAFEYKQMGVVMDGHFKKFNSQLSFDPEQPAKAKASFDVELASIDAGSPDADEEVAGKAWFNTKVFPAARFVSGAVKSLGSNRYEVAGKLSIKGKTQDVLFPVTFTQQGKNGVLAGGFTIHRADFSIGEGTWAKFDVVANDIVIKFRIAAASGK